jgi:hypothetical protein
MEGAVVQPPGVDAPEGYVVSFVAFHERGLGVPPSHFMRALLHYYKGSCTISPPTPSHRLPFSRRSARDTWGWSHTGICGSTSSGQNISPRRWASEGCGAQCTQGAAHSKFG